MLLLILSFAFYLFALWKRPFLYIGLAIQTSYKISRGLDLGRLPLVGPHDTIAFLAASIAAFSIPFAADLKERIQFQRIASGAAAVFTVIALISKQHNSPLPPVLKTFWFELHVVLAFLSYALFRFAALLAYL